MFTGQNRALSPEPEPGLLQFALCLSCSLVSLIYFISGWKLSAIVNVSQHVHAEPPQSAAAAETLPSKPVTHIQMLVSSYLCCLKKIWLWIHDERFHIPSSTLTYSCLVYCFIKRFFHGILQEALLSLLLKLLLFLQYWSFWYISISSSVNFSLTRAAQKYTVFLPLSGTDVSHLCSRLYLEWNWTEDTDVVECVIVHFSMPVVIFLLIRIQQQALLKLSYKNMKP